MPGCLLGAGDPSEQRWPCPHRLFITNQIITQINVGRHLTYMNSEGRTGGASGPERRDVTYFDWGSLGKEVCQLGKASQKWQLR